MTLAVTALRINIGAVAIRIDITVEGAQYSCLVPAIASLTDTSRSVNILARAVSIILAVHEELTL